ncbi:TatD family hydrolase [Myxococcus stipitatus DSM 14675]|uniref:TatD family hydrolase n=1 Tax=Myxococcus stipitatus (strain DSM 14675 / JCM 12634 / Mx s8) TaxID=1278073 RepID=L7UAC4_MYXSD|nr:TatD family hydrolase [Myxococcus stipitatus]AGC44542.1 TatD family hydrolase [Myxococcus stipitatus DSM 14675]
MRLVDAHCHLEVKDFADVGPVLERARAAGIVHAIVVGQFHGPGQWGNALELAARHPEFLSPTLGIHPHEAARATDEDLAMLDSTCARPEVRAVGEAGLDYYYDHSPREAQARIFRHQCELAVKLGKPLVVHVRDAHEDCDAILGEAKVSRGVIHCFTGDTDAARRYLDRGFFLSLSGVITYKKTEALQDAVRFAPLDRLMVETDSPYLAPVPHRGRKNEPSHVVETAKKLAELKGVALETVTEVTTANASALFNLTLR